MLPAVYNLALTLTRLVNIPDIGSRNIAILTIEDIGKYINNQGSCYQVIDAID